MPKKSSNVTQMGTYVRVPEMPDSFKAFVPDPLPPELQLQPDTINLLEEARGALGELNGAISLQPQLIPSALWSVFYSGEALDSSRIEGTVTSLANVLASQALSSSNGHKRKGKKDSKKENESAENDPDKDADDDVAEVRSYIAALDAGREALQGLPTSLHLIKQVHGVLMGNPRGAGKSPGEFRQEQNQIVSIDNRGVVTTVFVPPPVPEMETAMDDLERFINQHRISEPPGTDEPPRPRLPALIIIGLTHYQFETIHPFVDGNGRTGRLLILLQMLDHGLLKHPLLPLSTFLKKYQGEYYKFLRSVLKEGSFDAWLNFFLSGVKVQAKETLGQVEALSALYYSYKEKMAGDRSRASEVLDLAFANPVLTAGRVMAELGVASPSAHKLLNRLEEKGILAKLNRRDSLGRKFWMAPEVFAIFAPDEKPDLTGYHSTERLDDLASGRLDGAS